MQFCLGLRQNACDAKVQHREGGRISPCRLADRAAFAPRSTGRLDGCRTAGYGVADGAGDGAGVAGGSQVAKPRM